MDDVPNITPVKPLWPKRPDDKNPEQKRHQDDEKEKEEQQESDKSKSHKPDYDGQIDEYV